MGQISTSLCKILHSFPITYVIGYENDRWHTHPAPQCWWPKLAVKLFFETESKPVDRKSFEYWYLWPKLFRLLFPLNQVYFKAAGRRTFREEGDIALKSREEGVIGWKSREEGDLPSCPSPLRLKSCKKCDLFQINYVMLKIVSERKSFNGQSCRVTFYVISTFLTILTIVWLLRDYCVTILSCKTDVHVSTLLQKMSHIPCLWLRHGAACQKTAK